MQSKTLLSFLFLIFMVSAVNAQIEDPGPGSVTVFSEGGENFTLYLNGAQINASPASRVVADNISEVPVSFRIVFQNGAAPELTRKGLRQGKHCLYAIEKNKKGAFALKMNGCSTEPAPSTAQASAPGSVSTPSAMPAPAQLSATYANDVITINDGRTLTVKKVQVNGMTYPRVLMNAPAGAKVSITYDDNTEKYNAEVPLQYEVKDFSLNNAYLTLTVDEGGPAKTWHVKLKNSNGYDLKID